MNKTNMASEDIDTANLNKLRSVFPEFVKDKQIDFDALKVFFGKEGKLPENQEKYGLNWAGKSNAFKLIKTPATGTLVPDEKESVDFDKTENLFIEGDNLEVLKLLQKHYREQIKMIYIDPPYNTGKDFIYKDNFTEDKSDYYERTGQNSGGIPMTTNRDSSGRYHSDWLTMIYPRLFLARNLLKEDGVIFISIDDNEVANLRLIMDEIFGEENFVAQITVVGNPRGRDYGGVARMHDYVLVYLKSEESLINDLDDPAKEFPYEDKISGFEIRELRNRNIAFNDKNRPNLYYPFYVNPEKVDENGFNEIDLDKHEGWVEVYPKESQGYNTVWRWGKPRASENLNKEIAGKKMNDNGYMIIEKYRGKTKMARSVWWDKEDNTEKGTLEVKELFQNKVFDFPKSVDMIKKMIEMGTNKNSDDIILDFFAGSGTTAHAVMDLNAIDGGDRKWICVQLPEMTDENSEARKAGFENIAQIARERIRRAGKKIAVENEKRLPLDKETDLEDSDTGFKAYTLSKSNYRQWNLLTDEDSPEKLKKQMELFARKPLVDNFDEESMVYEILLKEGFNLNSGISEFTNNRGVYFWIVKGGEGGDDISHTMFVTFSPKVVLDDADEHNLGEGDLLVCLDSALDDTTKVNILRRKFSVKVI